VNWRLPLVVLTILVAGCGLFASEPVQTEQETLTPAPIPEETAVDSFGAAAPEESIGGVGDVDALVRGHLSQLRETSYTFRGSARYGSRDVEHVLRVESPRHYSYWTDSSATPGNLTEFADGTYQYRRDLRSGRQFDRTSATNATGRYGELATRIVRAHLPSRRGSVVETQFLGEPHFRVRVTYDTHPRFEGVENYSVRAMVTQGGLVRSMTVSYVRVDGGERVDVFESFVYTRVGETSVQRPTWVDRTWNETG
jgi:hypothetical protein